MLRLLLRLFIVLLVVIVLLAVIGPLLIDQRPAAAYQPPNVERVTATHDFVTIPSTGTNELRLHLRDSQPAAVEPQRRPPFLLLHGFTFNLSTWDASFDFFSGAGRTVAYDQLPYGLSDKPLSTLFDDNNLYSRQAAADRAINLLDQLQLSGAILVGNSSGGTLALDVALRVPERLSGLILINPWVYSNRPTLPSWLVNSPQMQGISLLIARYLGKETPLLERSYANPTRISAEQRALASNHRWVEGWDLAWADLLHRSLIETVTVSDSLAKVELPTLIIATAEDRIVKPQDSARAADSMPNASFVLLPDCGHAPQQECPEQVEAVIAHWLSARQ